MRTDRRGRTLSAANFLAPFLLFTSIYALARAAAVGRERPADSVQRGGSRPGQSKSEEVPTSEPGFFPRPLEGNYPVSLAVAIVALTPFIVVTTAYALFSKQVQADLHVDQRATEIVAGLSTAAYAWGALLGGDLVQRFRQRHVFLFCETLFVLGCIACALGHGMLPYGAGRIMSGLATGLLLVAALPPVIQNFPPEKLPITVVFINIGFFGAVCIGPLLGGWVAAGHNWRWFYVGLATVGGLNAVAALFQVPKMPPMNPGMRFDARAIALGLVGVALPFWASGELASHNFASFRFAVPMSTGLAFFIALLLVEYNEKDPLSPVKKMWTTPSLVGTLVAMIGGGVFVTFLELGEQFQMQVLHRAPVETGILFWPLSVGVCITAVLLGVLLRTRWLPILVLGGMATLIGGGALILNIGAGGSPNFTLAAAGLLGLGAGATVSPGLYLAALPLPTQIIGRVFALVELVRSLADYIIAPVVLRIARNGSAKPPLDWPGVHEAAWITLWMTVAFTAIGTAMWVIGGMGLPKPDIKAWISEKKPAFEPTSLFARLRRPHPAR